MRRRRSLAAGQASPTLALVSVALSALLVGLLPYLTDRPAGSAWLIPTIAWLQGMNSFGGAGLWLPSFAHPFAFSLLTAMLQLLCHALASNHDPQRLCSSRHDA